jgi:GT2 family glycosyltransferase
MDRRNKNLAILIATFNRHTELELLLISIASSTVYPHKIVIVYSGLDITNLVSKYQKILDIEIIYSPIANQSIQKSLGISSLGVEFKWVLFLDDDLVVETTAIEILIKSYLNNPEYSSYVGFGLGILNRSKRNLSAIVLKLLKFFKLYSSTPGIVLKSGHVQSYLDVNEEIDVKWLNGISVWNSKVLSKYVSNPMQVTYSAYEDVEFSYNVSKNYKLIFVPRIIVRNQKLEDSSPLTLDQYIHGNDLRYKFVSSHSELSKMWLLISQIVRGLDFIFRKNLDVKILRRISVVLRLWLKLFYLVIKSI